MTETTAVPAWKPGIQLRPYQEEANRCLWSAISERGVRRAAISMPTGGGKTATLSVFCARIIKKYGGPILWVAHRRELLDQAEKAFARTDPTIRVSRWDANTKDDSGDVVVASIGSTKTLSKRFLIVVIDEGHHAAVANEDEDDYENLYIKLLNRIQWSHLLLISATLQRLDGRAIAADELVYSVTFLDLVKKRRLARPIYVEMTTEEKAYLQVRGGEFTKKSLQTLDNPQRNGKIIDEFLKHRDRYGKTLMFVTSVEHCTSMRDQILAKDPTQEVRFLTGKDIQSVREETLAWFSEGDSSTKKLLINCFDSKTEVLTLRGWLRGDQITKDDYVLGMDTSRSDNLLQWVPVQEIVQRKTASGERMVRIENQGLDIRVTEGHRMLTRSADHQRWKVVEAGTLPIRGGSYQIPLAGLNPDQYDQPSRLDLTNDEMEFLGLFATDGTLSKTNGEVTICQKADAPECIEIERILDGCGFDWKVREYDRECELPNGTTFAGRYRYYSIVKGTGSGPQARRGWVARLGSWLNKSLDTRLKFCTREQFEHLLYGLWLGDGDKSSHKRRPNAGIRIYGVDWKMFDMLQEMAVQRGFASSLHIGTNGNGKPIGTLAFSERTFVRTNNHTVPTSGGNPARFEEVENEDVWCLQNKFGTVVTRRNGKVVITGQCEIFTEGYDEPTIKSVFLTRPTMSKALWMQMVGRGARIVTRPTEICLRDIVNREPAGDDGIERFTFSNGAQYYGEDKGLKYLAAGDIPVHTIDVQQDDEFYLVNVMDDITKFHALVEEWQLDVRERTKEELEVQELQDTLTQKRLQLKVLKEGEVSEDEEKLGELNDAQVRDLIGVLVISTYYHKNVGIPCDFERTAVIKRLMDFARDECVYSETKTSTRIDPHTGKKETITEENEVFDTAKFKDAYTHCITQAEFPKKIFELIRVAYYFRYIQGRQRVKYQKDEQYYETWKFVPLVDITPSTRQKHMENATRIAEEAKRLNNEFNSKYDTPEKQKALVTQVFDAVDDLEDVKEQSKKKVRNLRPALQVVHVKDRRISFFAAIEVTDERAAGMIGRVGHTMTIALQQILDDPSALVVISPKKSTWDSTGEAVGATA